MKISAWLLPPAFLLGAALGALATDGRGGSPVSSPSPQAPPPIHTAVDLDPLAVRADIRRILSEECARIEATVAPPAAAAELAATMPPSAPPGNAEAIESAHVVLTRALDAGAWTSDDVDALRTVMPLLTGPQREELREILFAALNEGRLRPDMGPRSPI